MAQGRPTVDVNGNGMSDIWEWIYGAVGLDPAGDPDGDGFPNSLEAIAATNPFDSNSYPRITLSSFSPTNFSVTLPCALGKQYQLLSATNLVSTNWLAETNLVARSGSNVTLSVPLPGAMMFYRVSISDIDSDGDGVNDWEEYQLGLDPFNAFSNGHQDGNGNPIGDYAYVTGLLAQQNIVTITATQPTATEPGPGEPSTALGQFTVARAGFPLNSITVNLGQGGPGPGFAALGLDFNPLPAAINLPAGTSAQTITVTPLANTNLQAPVWTQLNVLPGPGYTVGAAPSAGVLIYPSPAPNGTGLLGQYYTNSSSTYTNSKNFNPTNLVLTRVDPMIDFDWTNGTVPDLSGGYYSVRWTGQIQPQFSETYVFDVQSDAGCRLWVGDQLLINKWQSQSLTDWTNAITLQAGTLYDLKLEYLQYGGTAQARLYWYSPSQARTLIPNSAFFPNAGPGVGSGGAPSAITSALNAVAFLGQPFTFTVTAANNPLGFTATNLPPGLLLNSTNGVISGTPALAGNFEVSLAASNSVGLGASILTIAVLNTGSSVVQEIWTNVPGTSINAIPTGAPANITNALGALQGVANYGANYGERIRGFFTAPATGNYYFWIAASDTAQLWVSNDNDPVNKILRAGVAAPGVAPGQWTAQATQQSPWLSLVGGQAYYLEILHKVGVNSNANWSVGWLQDPAGTNTAPAGILPSYLLSRYYPPLPSTIPGTLYSANMLALPGANSQGVGSATLRLNSAGTQATLNFQFSNLKGTPTGLSINSDPYLNDPGELIFDISAAKAQANGSYLWTIKGTGPLATSDILEILSEGKASIVIESSAFPNGEISGHFTATDGTQTFTPPPPPPFWTDDSAETNAAVRFLAQATFGASSADIAAVQTLGYSNWLANQFSTPATHHLPFVLAHAYSDPTDPFQSPLTFAAWWQRSVTAPDQLRQRVAFALSEIFVISENGVLQNEATALSSYYDMLLDNAFGNFRTLLESVTLHPAMGLYLDMLGNTAGSEISGLHPDENYAREVQQLFSIGLNREWPDGTLILNAGGNLVPTYNQNIIMGFASVFTGWNYYQTNQGNGRLPSNWYPAANYTNSMVLVPSHHQLTTKLLLDNVMLPAAQGNAANTGLTNFDYYCAQDLEQALNCIFNNQNVAPFICRELIQRLVTSNPSRDYIYRVAQVFNDDGTGTRGNMQAVISAILLDYEARSPEMISQPTYGKQREPLLRVTSLARAFPPAPLDAAYSQTTNQVITVSTTVPHRLASGDVVYLTFTDTSGNSPPTDQGYSVTVLNGTNFTITSPQLASGTYVQSNNLITVDISGNGLTSNDPVYLAFTSGGAASGLYQISSNIDSAHFIVPTGNSTTLSGHCLLPKLSVGGYIQSGTSILISTTGPHGLSVGHNVFINFTSGSAASGIYSIVSVPDPTHFTITAATSAKHTDNGLSVYSLAAPQLDRSGTVLIQHETWSMGYTDGSGSSSLMETPLRSPTVFNFYYPGYEFPGALASAGLTTPEFQLTTDTGVSAQMDFIEQGVLGNGGNTNGLSSFSSGNGAIGLDLGSWMTPAYTTNSGLPSLVSALNTVLAAGQLSAGAQSNIIAYVAGTNFAYSNPPTATQMRDRVRAVVHLIANSPEYIIQK